MERLTYWGSVTFFCLLLLDRPIIIFIVKKHPQYKDLVCLQFDIVYWQVFFASTFPFPKTLNQLWIKYKGLIVVSNLSGSGTGKVTGTSGIVEEQLIPQLHLVQPQSLDVVLELGKLGIKRSLLCGQLNLRRSSVLKQVSMGKVILIRRSFEDEEGWKPTNFKNCSF